MAFKRTRFVVAKAVVNVVAKVAQIVQEEALNAAQEISKRVVKCVKKCRFFVFSRIFD